MELRQYWLLLRKWLWLLLLGAVLAGATALFVSRRMTPVYETASTLLVVPGSTQALDNYSALMATERLAQTYAALIDGEPILAEVYQRLGLPATSGANGQRYDAFEVSAQPVRDTQLVRVEVTGTDPALITQAANTLVEVFIEWLAGVQQSRYADTKANLAHEMGQIQASIAGTEAAIAALEEGEDPVDTSALRQLQEQLSQYRSSYSTLLSSFSSIGLAEASASDTVTVVSPATLPEVPVSPRVLQNALLAAIVGGMLTAGIAFLVEYLDDTIKEPADVEPTGLGVIATVGRAPDRANGRATGPQGSLYALSDGKSLITESYRTLRTNLRFSSLDRPLHSLVVASAVASEGKTTTAANLAVVMAQAGKRVVVVDADLRRPALDRAFGLPNDQGLTDALPRGPAELDGYLQSSGVENLRVLTSGPLPPNPQELLGSQRMDELLHKLEADSDLVIIDAAAALPVADANVLSARADGVLLVVHVGKTRRAALYQAVIGLRQVGANLVGIVFNMVDRRGAQSYYQYGYYYVGYGQEDASQAGGFRGWLGRLRRHGRRESGGDSPTGPEPGPDRQP